MSQFFLRSDGIPVFRIGTTTNGFASDGEPVFGLPDYVAPDVQLLRPIADIATNGWKSNLDPLLTYDGRPVFRISGSYGVASDGEPQFNLPAAPLYPAVNEVTANDATFIYSPDSPTTEEFEIKFSAGTGAPGSVTCRFRLQAVGLDTNFDCKIVSGTTVLDTWTENVTVAAGVVQRERTYTGAGVGASDLRLRGKARA